MLEPARYAVHWRPARLAPRTARAARTSIAFVMLLANVLAGCGSGLPRSTVITESPWKTFDEAKAAYDRIVPNRTSITELGDLGFDPFKTPNVHILSYLDIIERFMPHESIQPTDLDPAVRECIQAREACRGYEVRPTSIRNERVGNVLSDLFNFSRRTIRTGWSFHALIVFKDRRVLYKIWKGAPNVHEEEASENPFGPLQESPASMLKDTVTTIIPTM